MNFINSQKKKAVTFSFDDGVTQDIRLIELLNKYGLKATFNLNSELLGRKRMLVRGDGQRISQYIPRMLRLSMRGMRLPYIL